MIFFYTAFLFFTAMAIDGTIILTDRAKLQDITEATALTAASEFNYDTTVPSNRLEAEIENTETTTLNLLKTGRLDTANITRRDTKTTNKKLYLEVEAIARPYFLAFFGVNGIRIKAKACAKSAALSVDPDYGQDKINWINKAGTYTTDIIAADSDIKVPLGMPNEFSKSYILNPDTNSVIINYTLIEESGLPMSLGAGGYITIKLPSPIIDKPGYDLSIKEIGDAMEGYMVFAGIDKDTDEPYVHPLNESATGDIKWVNISCAGVSPKLAPGAAHDQRSTTGMGLQDIIYGSADFDISNSCLGSTSLAMAKYLRIIDDNQEVAFINQNGTYKKVTNLYGESSSATPGADIDKITVLNVVSLITFDEYNK